MDTSTNKKFSIIVPTYNRSKLLNNCLSTLVNQNYDKSAYEIIVVDNCSTDNTFKIVNTFAINYPEHRIKYIYEKNPGTVYALHTGAKNAKFSILSFTDDDGLLCPDWLYNISKVFNNNIAAVAGKINIKWDKPPPRWVLKYEELLGKKDYGNEIFYANDLYINGGNYHIKKEIFFQLGGFNPGQIGEWLIGDAETGLNKKLWEQNFLIGYSPNAVMEHCQFVDKNATVSDISRRYKNNGISVPFNILIKKKYKHLYLILNIIEKVVPLIFSYINEIYYYLLSEKELQYSSHFNSAYLSVQIVYTWNLFFNKKLKEYLLKENWRLD